MSNVAKLKKEAADLEGKKQPEKALAVYVKLLSEFERHPQEIDVALFNRVGDLQVKLGKVADGVDTFEKGVDHYAEGGFFNNAIAMCNKILRQAPGRASIYYKLGKISAQKGFKAEARQNFLEYADRMEKGGNTDEAFRALMEFMDLVPDQDDIRSMLADQLMKAKRPADALEQLQVLYERYSNDGKLAESDAVAERIHAIDPKVELRAGSGADQGGGGGLVFIDLDAPSTSAQAEPEPVPPPPVPPPAAKAPDPPAPPQPAAPAPPPPAMEVTRTSEVDVQPSSVTIGSLEIESTGLEDVGSADVSADSMTLEPTSFGEVSLDAPAPAAAPMKPAAKAIASPPPPAEAEMSLADTPVDTEMPNFGSMELPETAIAPVIDTRPPAKRESLDSFELAADHDSEPVAPSPPPKAAPPKLKPIGPPPKPPAAPPKPAAAPKLPVAAPKPAAAASAAAVPDFDVADIQESEHAPRRSTVFKAKALNLLAAAVQATPEDWSLRREYAEAMLEDGDRPGGIAELEVAMNGAENFDDLELAMAIAEELGKLEPQVVKHHQKRVEYAFRRNDRPRLVEAYLTLADALMRNEQSEKARAVYQRVLELSPDNMQAQAAVETIAPAPAPTAAPPLRTTGTAKRPTTATKPTAAPPKAAPADDGAFVNLGDWLRDDEGPKDTRMVVDEKEPTGDEDADFADMLKKFKQGVAENVDAEDYQSHYDLAIAFKEMGLLDEAIAGFQRALGSKTNRLPTYEALGECFLEKGQPKMAAAILQRGLGEQNATDEQLVGVLYLLGRAAEEQEQPAQALDYYQRVFVIDIQFRDVADRMSTVEKAAR